MDNFTWSGADAFKIFVVLHFLCYIPQDFIIMRYSTLQLLNLVSPPLLVHSSTP